MLEITPTFIRESVESDYSTGVNGVMINDKFQSKYSYRSRTINDWKGFFRAHGYKPVYPYSRVETRTHFEPGVMAISNLNGSIVRVQDTFDAFSLKIQAPMSISDLRSRARNHTAARFAKKAADGRMGLGEYLGPLGTGHAGEFRKTADMFLSTVVRTYNSVKELKRGNLANVAAQWRLSRAESLNMKQVYNRAKSEAEALSNAWLACRYGWLPAYSDVYGALTLLYDRTRELPSFRRVVATQGEGPLVFEELSDKERYGNSGRYDIPDVFYTPLCSVRTEVQYQLGAFMHMVDSYGNLNQQLGIPNPLSVLYQLTPGSFLLDWFTNIGDCLDALSAFHGLQWNTGWETFTYKTTVKVAYHDVKHRDLRRSAVFVKDPFFKYETMVTERKSLVSPPAVIPAFDIGFSTGDFHLNWKRQVDAIALGLQRVL